MGIGRFFRSLVDVEIMGEEVIATIEGMYRRGAKMYPNEDPHAILADVWLARMRANGSARKVPPELLQVKVMAETQLPACLPPPQNARALALFILHKERPQIFQEYPKFGYEFASLMDRLLQPGREEDVAAIYKQRNPNMAWAFDTEEFRRAGA